MGHIFKWEVAKQKYIQVNNIYIMAFFMLTALGPRFGGSSKTNKLKQNLFNIDICLIFLTLYQVQILVM